MPALAKEPYREGRDVNFYLKIHLQGLFGSIFSENKLSYIFPRNWNHMLTPKKS